MSEAHDTPAATTPEGLAAELTAAGYDVGLVLAAGRVLLEQLPPHEAVAQVMAFVGQPAGAAPPWEGM